MNLSETLAEIFFRLLNFGVVLGLLRYLYFHYISPIAHGDMDAEEKRVYNVGSAKRRILSARAGAHQGD